MKIHTWLLFVLVCKAAFCSVAQINIPWVTYNEWPTYLLDLEMEQIAAVVKIVNGWFSLGAATNATLRCGDGFHAPKTQLSIVLLTKYKSDSYT